MSEIVTTYDLAMSLKEVTTRGIPEVIATVAAVHGNVVFLTVSPSDEQDLFFAGELEVMSGPAENMRLAIIGSAADQISVSSTFRAPHVPEAGDTVKLSGGPLARSRIYMFEPDSTRGADYLVTVNTVTSKLTIRTLKNRIAAWLGFARETDYEVVCEAPMLTGDGDDLESIRDAAFDLKVLKEQCELMIVNFRMDERNRISGIGDIESTYAMVHRTGAQSSRYAAIIEFAIRQT